MLARLRIMFLSWVFFLAITLITPWQVLAQDQDQMQREIEELLVCQDGCGMIVSSCDNQTADYMRSIIKSKLAAGLNKQEILEYFVSIYGDQVIAQPPKKGFNLTAWIMPFLALTIGTIIVYTVLTKWVYLKPEPEVKDNSGVNEIDKAIFREKLEKELKKYL